MKKLAAILLALVMTTSLAACGGSGESSGTKETSAQSSASETKAEYVRGVEKVSRSARTQSLTIAARFSGASWPNPCSEAGSDL